MQKISSRNEKANAKNAASAVKDASILIPKQNSAKPTRKLHGSATKIFPSIKPTKNSGMLIESVDINLRNNKTFKDS